VLRASGDTSKSEFGLEQNPSRAELKKLGPLFETDWMPEHGSLRVYRFRNGMRWTVNLRYLERNCPSCNGEVFLRLTVIDVACPDGSVGRTSHVNHDSDLSRLKNLLIEYLGDDSKPVREVMVDNKWILTIHGEQVATELAGAGCPE